MAPGNYTELFFLDEATAFAAGHRPCFECRRNEAEKFKEFWLKGNPEYDFGKRTSIKQIDDIIHRERISPQNEKITYKAFGPTLPNGTFIVFDDHPYLISSQGMHRWTPFGYEGTSQLSSDARVKVLTPRSIVNAFRAGYVPSTK